MTAEEVLANLTVVCRNEKAQPEKPEQFAQSILWYMKAWGVVLKSDRSLPNEILCEDGSMAWIEPLIS